MKKLFFIILILSFITTGFARDIRRVYPTASLKGITLGIPLKRALQILDQNRIKINQGDILLQETGLNPYDILRKRIDNAYKPLIKNNIIVITTHFDSYNRQLGTTERRTADYFVDLLDTVIDSRRYFFFNKNRKYFIQYKQLKTITIPPRLISHLNPLLISAKLYFFEDILYRIDFKASLNLEEAHRLFENYRQRFRVNRIGDGLNIFFQPPYKYHFEVPAGLNELVMKRNLYLENDAKYSNHVVNMEMFNNRTVNRVRLYKSSCYEDFVRDIIVKTVVKITRARRAIETNVSENQNFRNREAVRSNSNVDEL